MSKYFRKAKDEMKFTKYLKTITDSDAKHIIKYLIRVFGDYKFPKDILDALTSYWCDEKSRYKVRGLYVTYEGLFEFYRKFPRLSGKALYEIANEYVRDLFDDYEMDKKLAELIKKYGEEDIAFEEFISYVSKKGDLLDKQYKEDVKKLDIYEKMYDIGDISLIPMVKQLVVEKHVKVDDAIAGLPSVKIIKQDMKHLEDLCAKYRIFIGCTYPVTFDMTKDYLLGEDLLEKYGDVPKYGISIAGRVQASFTTQEFLDSMKKTKIRKK